MRRPVLASAAGVVLLLLAGFGLWRALPSAGEGELLVLPDRVLAGPARASVAPWTPRAVVPASLTARTDATVDAGGGASWRFVLEADLACDGEAMDEHLRRELLAGARLNALAAGALEEGFGALGDLRVAPSTLARPAALAEPLRDELAARLPSGLTARAVRVSLDAPPEQARTLAMAEVRRSAGEPLARVLYVGLDGADWRIVDELLAEGKLPTFRRLLREGVRADLVPYEPMMSPLLWTTAVTGVGPDVHRVCDFTVDDADGQRIPITSRFRKVPALWEMLTAAGQASGFVNFYATQPAEEIDGVLVSDAGDDAVSAWDRKLPLPAGLAWPPGWIDERAGDLLTTDTVPAELIRRYVPWATDEQIDRARQFWHSKAARRAFRESQGEHGRRVEPLAFILEMATHSANLLAMTEELARDRSLGVVAVYFPDIDIAGHNFQHLAPPPHPLAPPEERKLFGRVIEQVYVEQDRALARLLEAAGPGTAVIIHSDHGFAWRETRPPDILPFTRGQPVEWHRRRGLFLAAGEPFARNVRGDDVTLFDIAPTILALRGLPAANDMPGRVRDDLFAPLARRRTNENRIATWNGLVPPRRFEAMDEEDMRRAREQMVESLRGLGYVGGEGGTDEDRPAATPASSTNTAGGEHPRVTYWRNLATYLMNNDRFEEAERALLEANRIKPLPKTYALISESRAARGDVSGAIAALEEGLTALPAQSSESSVLWLVELHLRQKDPAAAAAALERFRSIAARRPAVLHTAEGRIAEARGDTVAARRAYRAALEADPRQAQAMERLFALAGSAEARQQLEPLLRAGLARDPKIELYWSLLGTLLARRGAPGEAAEAFARAAELAPENPQHRANQALSLLRAGRKEQARRIYETLARAGAEIPAVWVNLGSLRAEKGDWKGALTAWERARGLGASSAGLERGIAEARRRLGMGTAGSSR